MGRPVVHITRLVEGLTAVAACLVASSATPAVAQSFTLVGTFPEGGSSFVNGLSDDGRSAAGWLNTTLHPNIGFFWNTSNGRNDFGLTANPSRGLGISGNGQYVVGGGAGSGARAFRWSEAGGYQNLGTLAPFPNSNATDASYDGSIVVGTLDAGFGGLAAFRWTQATGMQPIGMSNAHAISGDGNVIVGDQGTGPVAVVWTQAHGSQFLTPLGGTGGSTARATNFDGSIIVGNSGSTFLPVMWTNGVVAELHTFDNTTRLTPYAVSDDGFVVAGQLRNAGGGVFAGVWTEATGAIRLANYLTANGVHIPAGISLESCTAVSADGLTFAGYTAAGGGIGNIGFVATVPAPCPADLDNDGNLSNGGTRDHAVTIDDLLYFLTAFESGNLAADLDNGTGTGTHDGAVTVEDLLYFLSHFEAGC